MPISFSCKFCGKRLKAPDSAAGKTSKCPQCGKPVTCPEPVYDAEPVHEQPEILDDVDPYSDLDDGKPYGVSGPEEPDESSERRRPCPMCGEMILASAVKCRFCGEVFDEGLKKATKKKKKKKRSGGSGGYSREDEQLTAMDFVFAILCTNIACIVAIVYMIQGKPKGTKLLGLVAIIYVIAFGVGIVAGLLAPDRQQGPNNNNFQPPPNFQGAPNFPQPQPGFPGPRRRGPGMGPNIPPGAPPGFPQPNGI